MVVGISAETISNFLVLPLNDLIISALFSIPCDLYIQYYADKIEEHNLDADNSAIAGEYRWIKPKINDE